MRLEWKPCILESLNMFLQDQEVRSKWMHHRIRHGIILIPQVYWNWLIELIIGYITKFIILLEQVDAINGVEELNVGN